VVSVPPSTSAGATTASGATSWITSASSAKASELGSATGDASFAVSTTISISGSSMASRTCSTTASLVSPGSSRKLTRAEASRGSTFAFTPPSIMVTAVVVRTIALVLGSRSSRDSISGPNSPGQASTRRWMP